MAKAIQPAQTRSIDELLFSNFLSVCRPSVKLSKNIRKTCEENHRRIAPERKARRISHLKTFVRLIDDKEDVELDVE